MIAASTATGILHEQSAGFSFRFSLPSAKRHSLPYLNKVFICYIKCVVHTGWLLTYEYTIFYSYGIFYWRFEIDQNQNHLYSIVKQQKNLTGGTDSYIIV